MRATLVGLGLMPVAAACGKPAAVGALERFPLAPRVVCVDSITEDGRTRESTSIEECRREGDRVRCTQTVVDRGETTVGWGEERVDAAGHWAVGNDAYTLEPPVLVFPADIAPGATWTTETVMAMRGSDQRVPISKSYVVSASDQCEGGLRIETVRQATTPGAARTENDLHVCPGMSSPRSYTSRTVNDAGVVRTIVGTCRAEAAPPGPE